MTTPRQCPRAEVASVLQLAVTLLDVVKHHTDGGGPLLETMQPKTWLIHTLAGEVHLLFHNYRWHTTVL